jgi:hypothetical protein
MSQANVYTSVANAVWYTDKAMVSTGNTAVTYNVYATALGTVAAVGNIYSNAVSIPAYKTEYVYVGVGNYLTIIGSNFTATESGTATSAQAGVIGSGSY